jgi:cellulose synthase/poly-beta-1,6-N-acetylglucosamine synthase-like glycosyltransferase
LELPSPIIIAYLAILSVLGFYGLHRLMMVWHFRWNSEEDLKVVEGRQWPVVTVQLPLYNERTVAARLIQAVGKLNYPVDCLEIQVLDDSTDETCTLVDLEVAKLVSAGIDAKVIRREDRVGFKAGALDYGMNTSRGEFIAIFDADFLPDSEFLRNLVPNFDESEVGMVQARWEHVNRDENALTRAQSTLLDGHFVIEHKVRHDRGLFFNFNGTAGIWRRETIEDAGGWQHDTLTEDLDLSYRAQLGGWRFVYVPMVDAPAEIPQDIAAFKSQQHRWAKGSVQVARKLGRPILKSNIPWRVKLEAFAHLTSNAGYPLVLVLAVILPLAVREQTTLGSLSHLGIFMICTVSVMLFYERSQQAVGRTVRERFRDVPAAMSLGIGMCVTQTKAIFEGLFHDTGEFVRTPKRGDDRTKTQYRASLLGLPGIELLFAAWFAWGLVGAVNLNLWGSLPFLFLFFWGFTWVGSLTLRDWLRAR